MKSNLTVSAIIAATVTFIALMITGCDLGPKSARGFSLPDGNAETGQQVYQTLQCNACHVIDGVAQLTSDEGPGLSIKLGGKVTRIQTYGELVTSVINPSHRLAKGYPAADIQSNGVSKMRNYNDTMTISQLINLVAFLQSKYELQTYHRTRYPIYGP